MNLSENSIEIFAIKQLQRLGYQYLPGLSLAPAPQGGERSSYQEVLLTARLQEALQRLNPSLPQSALEEAFRKVEGIGSGNLLEDNQAFHKLLTQGIPVSYQKDGQERGALAQLLDLEELGNNDFLVTNQFTVQEKESRKRLDIVLFINGLPLVVVEMKNPINEQATLDTAYQQLQTYKAVLPTLFAYNGLLVISDGLEARAGSLSAGFSRFMAWKSADGEAEASPLVNQLEILLYGLLDRATLLDLLQHFVVFEKQKKEDDQGIVTISTIKKIAAYHQYYAVNKAVASTLRAVDYNQEERQAISQVAEPPAKYGLLGVKKQPQGDRKAGVVWHTQGSGKSLSMVFYTGKIVLALDNPTILVITDRNDLDDQLFDTFAGAVDLLRQAPKQANTRQELKELLAVNAGGVVFSTIQKFQPEEGNVFETLSKRKNIVVIVDEAHRTQYGLTAKVVDDKNEKGEVVGKKVVYGFAKYMRDALPHATYLGFTGTPIEKAEANTPAVFGNYIDVYDIAKAVEDGATVPIYYESRLAKVAISEEGKELIEAWEEELEEEELLQSQAAKAKWSKLEALVGSEARLKNVAQDIVEHYEKRQEVFDGKAMIVAMSRRIAAALYQEIIQLKPDWHHDDLNKGVIKVVMTTNSSDGPAIAQHHTTKSQRKFLAQRMKDEEDELQLVIVRDMWLTGFDAPSLHTLYIDKPMKGHSLMQAITRVNRVYQDKPAGLVVDYLGIAHDLKKALSFYVDAGGKGDPAIAQEQAVVMALEKIEVIDDLFYGYDYEPFFEADTSRKLTIILEAENHILGLEEGRKRYIKAVTELSKAFAIAVPQPEVLAIKEEVSFFQAVKARLAKFDAPIGGKTNVEIETTIRQIIDQALVSEEVVDIFDAAGIKKPNISILSEEFLQEIKNMKHRNIALEVLKRLLSDEIRARTKKNLVQGKSLMELLDKAIKRYQNKVLTTAQVIEELIAISRQIVSLDQEYKDLGLTEFEYAFYTAIARNESAKEFMKKEELRELAVALTAQVKQNATIDWTIKESVRAKLKVMVKRTLRKYGYPPDMQKLATDTVIKQAEKIAQELLEDK